MKYILLFTLSVLLSTATVFSQNLKKLIGQPLNSDIRAAVLLAPDSTATTLGQVIDQLSGQVVYIDFWASWCHTCLGEMPSTSSIKNTYEGKDVTILYISVDEKHDEWKRAVDDLSMTSNSYRILKTSKPPIQKEFKIDGIPYFILLDKNGKIADPRARWPSDSSILQDIQTALNN